MRSTRPVPMRNFVKDKFQTFFLLTNGVFRTDPTPSSEPASEEKERAG